MTYDDEEDNSERCEHGLLWEYECAMCEKEQREFYCELLTMLGAGDPEEGRKWLIKALKETKRPCDDTRASESK